MTEGQSRTAWKRRKNEKGHRNNVVCVHPMRYKLPRMTARKVSSSVTVDFHGRSFSKAQAVVLNLAALAGRGDGAFPFLLQVVSDVGKEESRPQSELLSGEPREKYSPSVPQPQRTLLLRTPTMCTNNLNEQKPCAAPHLLPFIGAKAQSRIRAARGMACNSSILEAGAGGLP